MKYRTPDLGARSERSCDVYDPAEDTFLLMDALEADSAILLHLRPLLVLEVGSGSGCVSVFACGMLRQLLGRNVLALATDINAAATKATLRCARRNTNRSPLLDAVHGSLALSVRKTGLVDVVLFNPPYVPSERVFEEGSIDSAWAGGLHGREIVDRLLLSLANNDGQCLLAPRALAYIVALEENSPRELIATAIATGIFKTGSIVLSRSFGVERLHVIRLCRF